MQIENTLSMNFAGFLNNTNTLILLSIMALAFVGLMLYYGLFYLRVALWKDKKTVSGDQSDAHFLPPVSVVLAACNESFYLKESLYVLLDQDYPEFEVVVVDYVSKDDTPFVLQMCKENFPDRMKIIPMKEDVNFFLGKKFPLTLGIRSAKYDHIILTEPDTLPQNRDWIRSMMAGYTGGTAIVMGYNGILQEKGFLNRLQQYDHMNQISHCFGRAMMGRPYTALNRNISFRKQFFFDKGAFTHHYTEPHGAADLFVNENASKTNTRIMLNKDSIVQAVPRTTASQWREQRRAYFAPKRYYGWMDKLRLAWRWILLLLLYAAIAVFLVFDINSWIIPSAVVLLLWIWQIVTFSRLCKRFEVKKIALLAPLYEIYFLFPNTILMLLALFKKK